MNTDKWSKDKAEGPSTGKQGTLVFTFVFLLRYPQIWSLLTDI